MSKLDADIRHAFDSLEGEVSQGYFDQLADRIEARLEADAMEGSDMDERDDRAPGAPPAPEAAAEGPTENTGLHDIKALAKNTRRRISQRVSTESDAKESLLASSSQVLSAVALPEPGKDRPRFATEDGVATPGASPAEAAAPAGERRSGTPVWLYAAAGVVAAAAVVFLVIRGGGGDGDSGGGEQMAANAEQPPEPEPAVVPADVPEAEPDEPIAAGDEAADSAEPEEGGEDGDEGAEVVAAGSADRDDSRPERKSSKASGGTTGKGSKGSRSGAGSTSSAAKTSGTSRSKPGGGEADESDTSAGSTSTTRSDGDQSIEDLLAEAAGDSGGGSDSGGKDEEKKETKPSKKDLSRADITSGMRKIGGQVKACYEQHQEPGQVLVSLTIDPSGQVTSAKATGAFAGTPTGKCVAAAVKGASFPAWDGRRKSLSYPFLLSD